MSELLSRDTSMQIHRVEDGMRIEANHVYLLPPKKEIIAVGGELHLIDKDPSKGLTLPIDKFFESLAREYGARAVGIGLSGSGSDGSRGVRDIAHLVTRDNLTSADRLRSAAYRVRFSPFRPKKHRSQEPPRIRSRRSCLESCIPLLQ